MQIGGVRRPATAAADAALTVTRRHAGPALRNHALRSYWWAAHLAASRGLDVDEELLWVAALLHDLGLEAPFDSHRLPFEVAGGQLGWVFAIGAGWSPERAQRVSEVIERHMHVAVDPAVDPEGHVLEVATSFDIRGAHVELWDERFTAEVLRAVPRLDLDVRFSACLAEQAARKPDSQAARAVRTGLLDQVRRPWTAVGPAAAVAPAAVTPAAVPPDAKDWTWVLDRPCPECGLDTRTVDAVAVAGLIRANAVEWDAVLRAPDVRHRPAPQVWSPLEYGCHVRDVYRLYDRRLRLMLDEDDPLYPDWDQDATAVEQRYGEQDPDRVRAELRQAAATIADRFDSVTGDRWQRPGRRGDGAHFTVATFARYLLHDPVHHLHDATAAAARR